MLNGCSKETIVEADVVIVGGGLAGASAAFVLSRHGWAVQLLEAETPGAGASGAAAGSVNPFMGRRARPTWRMDAALEALRWITEAAEAHDLFRPMGVLRPAQSEKQAGHFREVTANHPARTRWLAADAVSERFPAVRAPEGALWIEDGGAADVPALIGALLQAARAHGAAIETNARVTGWSEQSDDVTVEFTDGAASETVTGQHLLLCMGQDFKSLPGLQTLDLQAVKGQTLRLRRPDALEGALLPCLSGSGYVVPHGADMLLAGSTYEHDFTDLEPTAEGQRYILENVRQMLPPLHEAEVLSAQAGARVSPSGSHLPAVGPLPESDGRVWVFTALGSRGLLTGPLLAREMPSFVEDPARIPDAVRA